MKSKLSMKSSQPSSQSASKLFSTLSQVTLLTLVCGLSAAYAEGLHRDIEVQTLEVPLESFLAPYRGYDDTNNVEVVLHGTLPNTCYRLDNSVVERSAGSNTIRVRQFAVKKMDGVCGEGNTMPEHLAMTVPFSTVISLGSLTPGDYNFTYQDSESHLKQKALNVKKAHKTTIDDYPYAAVSNATTTDVIQKNEKVNVSLSGVFTSTCAYLDSDSIKVEKQNDVYVVLPVVKMKTGVLCAQSMVPFTQGFSMEAPKAAGHYLVHVRSMNGKSVNRVVDVLE